MVILHKRRLEKLLHGRHAFLRVILLVSALATSISPTWAQFTVDGITYTVNEDGSTCYVSGCSISVTEAVIPETVTDESGKSYSVTSIGNDAFHYNRSLTSIKISDSVTSIGDGAFKDCYNLSSIELSNSLVSIGTSAFGHCNQLSSIEIPNSVTSIGVAAFSDCYSLSSIVIPASITEIADRLLLNCNGLTSVEILGPVTSLGDMAFQGCSSLTSIDIPASVRSIGDGAFYRCSKLAYVGIPYSVTSIGREAFYECSSLASIDIPRSVTSIGIGAFRGCSGLVSIRIPNSITDIADRVFMWCDGLTSVEIPTSVTSIGASSFAVCKSLSSIEIPNSVTSIGSSAFAYCTLLSSVYSLAPTPPTIQDDTFENVDKSPCILYVPKGCTSSYATAKGWSEFSNIFEIGSSTGLDAEEWEILQSIREDLMAKGWNCPWDMSLGANGVSSFEGLAVVQGHAVGLNLSGSNLSGDFPWSVLGLPYLEELNLSGNDLSGDIGAGMLAAIEANPTATQNLKKVNISGNKFCGNIAQFANDCPALQYLDASGNCLKDVVPAILPNVTTLLLEGQAINEVVDLDLTGSTPEGVPVSVPTIWTYNHAAQAWDKPVSMLCTTGNLSDIKLGSWEVTIGNDTDWLVRLSTASAGLYGLSPARSLGANIYYGESGDVLNVMLIDEGSSPIRNMGTLKMRLTFAPGDANFSGDVDVTDLQAIILQILRQNAGRLFNYTAANTVEDETLNVQDVVGEVNLLLSSTPGSPAQQRCAAEAIKAAETASATVYCIGNELRICSEEPVAAFDLFVSGATSLSMSDALRDCGLTCMTQQTADGVRLIGYSLSGDALPAGDRTIALHEGDEARVSAATLSDARAQKISTVLNLQPTAIGQAQAGAGVSVEIRDGRLAIEASGAEGDVRWSILTQDGRFIGEGTIAQGAGRQSIDLGVRGVMIVKIECGSMKLTKKIINNP